MFSVFAHAQCTLWTCHHCEIQSSCNEGGSIVPSLIDCLELIDNVTVLAVEYNPSTKRCIAALCLEFSFTSQDKRVYHYSCDTECRPPPTINHGNVSIQGLLVDDTATYACEYGYVLSGDELRFCQNDSLWSGIAPFCVPISNNTADSTSVPATSSASTMTSSFDTPSSPVNTMMSTTVAVTTNKALNSTNSSNNFEIATLTDSYGPDNPDFPITTSTVANAVTSMTSSDTTGSNALNITTTKTNGLKPLYIWPCTCKITSEYSDLSEEEIVQRLIADTMVDKRTTTVAINKLVSKPDYRKSANAIGTAGIVIMVACFCALVVFDFINVLSGCKNN
ncbi:hypothetical protein ACF0H5_022795 [Mactra antiquata]